jgi:hypothetical protein
MTSTRPPATAQTELKAPGSPAAGTDRRRAAVDLDAAIADRTIAPRQRQPIALARARNRPVATAPAALSAPPN